eukprot:1466442-Prymnesium_polylepis.1
MRLTRHDAISHSSHTGLGSATARNEKGDVNKHDYGVVVRSGIRDAFKEGSARHPRSHARSKQVAEQLE